MNSGLSERHLPAFLLLLLFIAALAGCVESRTRVVEKDFPLVVVIGAFESAANEKILRDIVTLSLPIEGDCSGGVLYFAEVTVVIPGTPERKTRSIKTSKLGDWTLLVRNFLGSPTDLVRRRAEIEEGLTAELRTWGLATPAVTGAARDESITKFLLRQPGAKVFVIAPADRAAFSSGLLPAGKTLAALATIDGLRRDMAKDLCLLKTDHPAHGLPHLVLFDQRHPVAAQPGGAHVSAAVAVPKCEEIYSELSRSARDPGLRDRNALDEKLRETGTLTCPNNYRFPYERARLAVYGRTEHASAFGLLSTAAEIAIRNGEAEQMMSAMSSDGKADGAFEKLATNHREWTTIFAALRTRDVSSVRR
jgi:hypothetical protein